MKSALLVIPFLLVGLVPVAFGQVVETTGQNYDLIEDYNIGEAKWTSHPERIMVNGEWENYFLQADDQQIIFRSNSVGGFIYDIPSCSYSIYDNGFDGNQIIPSVSSVASYNVNGNWQNMEVNQEECLVNYSQGTNGIFITSTKTLFGQENQPIFFGFNGTGSTVNVNGTSYNVVSNGNQTGYYIDNFVNVETEKFVQELKVDIFGGIKETFKVWNESDEPLGISQTVHTGESITIGENTLNIAELNGQSFNKQFLEDNKAQVFEIAESVNYDFKDGFDSLSNVNIFFDGDYKVNLDYASGNFVNYLEIDPTFSATTTSDKSVRASGTNNCSGGDFIYDNSAELFLVYMYPSGSSNSCYRSYIEFDISSIPSGYTVTDSYLTLLVSNNYSMSSDAIDVYSMTTQGSTIGTASTMFGAIVSSKQLLNADTTLSSATGDTNVDLSSNGDTEIESLRSANQNWISFGFKMDNESTFNGNHRGLDISPSEEAGTDPTLTVVYSIPTAPQPPTNLQTVTGIPIELSWTAPVDDGGSSLTGYKVYRTLNQYVMTELPSNGGTTGVDFTDNELLLHDITLNVPTTVNAYQQIIGYDGGNGGTGFFNSSPTGVFVDSNGDIFGVDRYGQRILKWDSSGTHIGTFAISGTSYPAHVREDSQGNYWVTATNANEFRKYSPTFTLLNTYTGGTYPFGLAIDKNGDIWIANQGNNDVRKYSSTGTLLLTISGIGSGTNGGAFDLLYHEDHIWISNRTQNKVSQYDLSGNLVFEFTPSSCSTPMGVYITPVDDIVVSCSGSNTINTYDSSGTFVSSFGSSGSGNGQFSSPRNLSVDSDGYLYVLESGNYRIQKFGLILYNTEVTDYSPNSLTMTINGGLETTGVFDNGISTPDLEVTSSLLPDATDSFTVGSWVKQVESRDTSTDGTIGSVSTSVTGKIGSAWDLPNSSYITVDNLESYFGSSDWTMGGWIKPTANGGTWSPFYFGFGNGSPTDYTIYSDNNGKWGGELGSSPEAAYYSQTGSTPVVANTWYHVIIVHDNTAGTITYYLNNGNIGTQSMGVQVPTASDDLYIGSGRANTSVASSAIYDEFAVWDKALSSSEVSSLYNSGNGAEADTVANSNLVAYYDFEQTPSTTLENQVSGILPPTNTKLFGFTNSNGDDVTFNVGTTTADFKVNTTPIISATGLADNTSAYHHYALTRDGSSWTLYQDGSSVATTTDNTDLGTVSGSHKINLDGSIDEYFIDSTALTSNEVETVYGMGSEPALLTTTGTTPEYDDSGVTGGNTYYYYVKATNAIGDSDFSTQATGLAGTPPDAPTGLSASIQNTNTAPRDIFLQWSAPTNVGSGTLTGFEIWRDGSLVTTVGLISSYVDIVPTVGTYTYTVKAVSTHGTSVDSNSAQITTPNVPDAPQGLTLSIDNPDPSPLTVTVTISPPLNDGGSAVTGYNIYTSTDDITYTLQASNTSNPSNITVASAGLWYFKAEAVNGVGAGALSSNAIIGTPNVPDAPTSVTTNIPDVNNAPSSVVIAWSNGLTNGGSAITGYNVYRDGSLITSLGTGIFTYTDTATKTASTTYTYEVRITNNVGESLGTQSNITTPSPPNAPVLSVETGTTKATWTVPTSDATITNYKLYRDGSLVATVSGSTTTYIDRTLITFGNSYNYQVSAVSSIGEGTLSNTVTTTPDTNVDDATAFGTTGTSSIIDWTEPPYFQGEVTSYSVYYSTPYSSNPSTLIGTTGNTYLNLYNQLQYDTNYAFMVLVNSPLGNTSVGNVVNATTTENLGIVTFDPTTGSDWFDIDAVNQEELNLTTYTRTEGNGGTLLGVTYPTNYESMTCDINYRFGQETLQYTEGEDITATPIDAAKQLMVFQFNNQDSEVIYIECADQSVPNSASSYTLTTTFGNFPLLTQIDNFRSGQYGTEGLFGSLDLITLFVVIISMVGFNRVSPIAGVIIGVSALLGMAYFEITSLPATLIGVFALIAFLAWGVTRK